MRKALLSFILGCSACSAVAVEVSGLVRLSAVRADDLASFQNLGTGILRYDENALTLNQTVLTLKQDFSKDWSVEGVLNYYPDGEQKAGISQLEVIYKPITPSKIKWKVKAGFFFPELSLENVDEGWQTPFTYTNSAINSWIGEELRTPGVEFTLFSPGRARGSAWSWNLHAAAYKGNDTIGALLAWRGWSFNDRQSLNNDLIRFAPIPTVLDQNLINGPNYVEPFHELDGRFGIYVGAKLDRYKTTSLRYYYYDNLANPKAVNQQRLYAWHTAFHSLSAQHKFNSKTRLIGQFMYGNTEMGLNFVNADFSAWFLMLSHREGQHRFSVRYDKFKVRDAGDIFPEDLNDSDGHGVTFAWRYLMNKNWEIGFEHHLNSNQAQNRSTLNQVTAVSQQQSQLVLQYRWR